VTSQTIGAEKADAPSHFTTTLIRLFGWLMLSFTVVYVVNNFLTYGAGLPGASSAFGENASTLSWLQAAFYPILMFISVLFVMRTPSNTLRQDSSKITAYNTVFIRCAFWAVLIVGLGDFIVSFLRVEDLLSGLIGEELASAMGRAQFRGVYFHIPLILIGVFLGFVTRTLGFTWLAFLIVAAELLIVISRFIFSYEQAFMGDLVRFWYGALFLFASAYTLLEEGHVRVDVFYAGFKSKTKGLVNALGSVALGMSLCWTILIVGMAGEFSIINAPVFSFEITQSGFGMYVKYMMAGFLGVFAISMLVQFVAYMMDAVADYREEPGKRELKVASAH